MPSSACKKKHRDHHFLSIRLDEMQLGREVRGIGHDDASVCSGGFFFNDTATTEIYTLSLHDALPISLPRRVQCWPVRSTSCCVRWAGANPPGSGEIRLVGCSSRTGRRSAWHTLRAARE